MEENNRRKRILLELDVKKSPETVAYLKQHLNDEISSYDLATELVLCDRTRDMPRVLFDYIVDLYKDAIEAENTDAMNDLGALYYDGRGCEQDFTKAVFYYDMAAQLGNQQAQENLGYCYYYGRNLPVDYEKAFNYFALGAFDGRLISLYKIGDMYLNGYYVKKNPYEAFRIYERCIRNDLEPSVAGPLFLRLGNCFLNGLGTEENAETALTCFQNAEHYLYDMVASGDVMYKKSLQAAINGQIKAREKLTADIPQKEWEHDD